MRLLDMLLGTGVTSGSHDRTGSKLLDDVDMGRQPPRDVAANDEIIALLASLLKGGASEPAAEGISEGDLDYLRDLLKGLEEPENAPHNYFEPPREPYARREGRY